MKNNSIDFFGVLLISIFLILLSYAGFLAYQSIDWQVLSRLEKEPIILPTPQLASPSASVSQKP